ncbi:MAG: NAD-dependent succinate-semialdehyde dehydrogenase [Alphaproteobacteria bacterium]|nr:NAD-dependent succinate-semialdehyde dehydrogenase [Alphaproteobacteria bacterium]
MTDAAKAIQDRNLLFRNRGLIGGVWCDADNERRFPVSDPATGKVIAEVPLMGAAETRRAIAAANEAFAPWAAMPAQQRGDILMRWYELMLRNEEDLGRLMTAEQGKPLPEARGEIRYAASFVRFFAEEARRVYGETIPSPKGDARIVVLRQPIGVVACITPWNFPAAMITRKAAPALAAGCTVVLKPAEATPLSALALAALAEQAGVPAGVFNVVTGEPKEIGLELCSNTAVRKLSFTGSTATGRLLAAQCAPTIKKLSLELGGNAPFIVFDDADLEAAVAGAMLSKYRHSGQTCVCTNRFLVQTGIYDAFARRLVEEVKKLKLGNGFEPGVTIGPLINDAAIAKVKAHVADALDKGADLLVGGKANPAGSRFFEPTVLSGVTTSMAMMQEETFGPVAGLTRFKNEADAVRIANDTEYGLAGYFYSRDFARTWRVAEQLECGMVGINTGFLSVESAPFGGIKQSGIGREGSHHGLAEFLQLKYLNIGEIR